MIDVVTKNIPKLTRTIQVVAMIILISAGLALYLFGSQEDSQSKVLAFVVFAVLALCALYVLVAVQRIGRAVETTSVRLNSRREMLRKAEELIRNARNYVLDTTWGRTPAQPNDDARDALNGYLNARTKLVQSSDVEYCEVFSDLDERRQRIEASLRLGMINPKYRVSVLSAEKSRMRMLDFLVVDGRHMILSYVDEDLAPGGTKFVYIESEVIAGLYVEYHRDCFKLGEAYTKKILASIEGVKSKVEQGGADQPATDTESKPEGNQES